MSVQILHGDCRAVLATLPEQLVHCVVTSPPYWGLRDYGIPPTICDGDPACAHEWGGLLPARPGCGNKPGDYSTSSLTNPKRQDEISRSSDSGSFCRLCGAWRGVHGLEPTIDRYVQHAVEIFRLVRRVMRDDATLWLNLGDSYTSGVRATRDPGKSKLHPAFFGDAYAHGLRPPTPDDLKPKDLCMIPARVALALQADGWWLRSEIVWAKPNPMPESITDRPTSAHEKIFLLSKRAKYFYDADAVMEKVSGGAHAHGHNTRNPKATEPGLGIKNNRSFVAAVHNRTAADLPTSRNLRNVWHLATEPFPEAHFATFPTELARRCILAGCPAGGAALDPFGGSGTVGLAAARLQRNAILIEAKAEYVEMARQRIAKDAPLLMSAP